MQAYQIIRALQQRGVVYMYQGLDARCLAFRLIGISVEISEERERKRERERNRETERECNLDAT